MVSQGLGNPVYDVDLDAIDNFLKGLYITEVCWTLAIFMVKCALIAFYWRIFSNIRHARTAILFLLGATLCWGIAVVGRKNPSMVVPMLN